MTLFRQVFSPVLTSPGTPCCVATADFDWHQATGAAETRRVAEKQKYASESRLQLGLLINVYARFLSTPCPAVYFHLLLFTSWFEKERKKFAFDI